MLISNCLCVCYCFRPGSIRANAFRGQRFSYLGSKNHFLRDLQLGLRLLVPSKSFVAFPAGVTALLLPGLERLFKEEFFIISFSKRIVLLAKSIPAARIHAPSYGGGRRGDQSRPLVGTPQRTRR